ncbi:hypothetical protein ABKN59_009642 [Abortiporus biennis]
MPNLDAFPYPSSPTLPQSPYFQNQTQSSQSSASPIIRPKTLRSNSRRSIGSIAEVQSPSHPHLVTGPPESPTARSRRSPSPSSSTSDNSSLVSGLSNHDEHQLQPSASQHHTQPQRESIIISSSTTEHKVSLRIPWAEKEIIPEMITVSAKRGDRLGVVADVWDKEVDSHYEWEIQYPPRDVDMSSIRVHLGDGYITIKARRYSYQGVISVSTIGPGKGEAEGERPQGQGQGRGCMHARVRCL